MSLTSILQAVKTLRDSPDPETYFTDMDMWHYISISDKRRCQHCEGFDNMEFFGSQLEATFPDLTIRSVNIIDPNVHITMWNQPTCRCKLVRMKMSDPKMVQEYNKLVKEYEKKVGLPPEELPAEYEKRLEQYKTQMGEYEDLEELLLITLVLREKNKKRKNQNVNKT